MLGTQQEAYITVSGGYDSQSPVKKSFTSSTSQFESLLDNTSQLYSLMY